MNDTITIIILIIGLFGVGVYALLRSRNLMKIIIALQLLVKGVLVSIILAGKLQGQIALSQSMGVSIIVADTIIAVLGLALAIQIRKKLGTLDVKALSSLRR